MTQLGALECRQAAEANSLLLTEETIRMADLVGFVGTISGYGETGASIVFSTPTERRR